MVPAFRSTKEAGGFTLLLAVLLLLPVVVPSSWQPTREQSYQTEGWQAGPFPWLHQEIFQEKGDIDIAFMGSSHIQDAIDTPYVEAELTKQLGHPAVVRTIAWGGSGYDALYFITKALLDHRKVHTLVFYDENNSTHRNYLSPVWFRWPEDASDLGGLPWEAKARFYLAAVLSMPRKLLGIIHPNLPADMSPGIPHELTTTYHAPNPDTRLGSLRVEVGYNDGSGFAPFVHFVPPIDDKVNEVEVYSGERKGNFRFGPAPIPNWEDYFLKNFGAMTSEYGTRLVMLHIPTISERRSPMVNERAYWPEVVHTDVTMVGIAPAVLFQNLSEDDVMKLYCDPEHLNRNGMEYFTRVMTPTLLQIYGLPERD
jgi:hypothetical protein